MTTLNQSDYYDSRFSDQYDSLFGIKINIGKNRDKSKNLLGGQKKDKKDRKSFSQIVSSVAGTAGKGIDLFKKIKGNGDNSVDVDTAENFAIVNPSADQQAAADKKKKAILIYSAVGVFVVILVIVIILRFKK